MYLKLIIDCCTSWPLVKSACIWVIDTFQKFALDDSSKVFWSSRPLTKIFNHPLLTGDLPSEWECAKATAIHKDGPKNNPSNYRPISVLSITMQGFEQLVHDQVYKYIHENDILNSNQSGFRPGHSTTTTLIDVSDYIPKQMDSGKITGVIYLDLNKFRYGWNCLPLVLIPLNYTGLKVTLQTEAKL